MATRPIILTVDDEPQVLNAVERDLRRHYRNEYRIIKAGSGAEALDVARQLLQRGDPLALFLADQRMPRMSGTEFLTEAIKFYPDARKVLLTAYADTQAAIDSIRAHKAVYLIAIGGAAYLVSKAIRKSRVVAFADLGMEAIHEFEVEEMPVTVAVDTSGNSVHRSGPEQWQARIAAQKVTIR